MPEGKRRPNIRPVPNDRTSSTTTTTTEAPGDDDSNGPSRRLDLNVTLRGGTGLGGGFTGLEVGLIASLTIVLFGVGVTIVFVWSRRSGAQMCITRSRRVTRTREGNTVRATEQETVSTSSDDILFLNPLAGTSTYRRSPGQTGIDMSNINIGLPELPDSESDDEPGDDFHEFATVRGKSAPPTPSPRPPLKSGAAAASRGRGRGKRGIKND